MLEFYKALVFIMKEFFKVLKLEFYQKIKKTKSQ